MVPMDKRVRLISQDLQKFNPPEVYCMMQQKMLECNEMPSPQFNKNKSFMKSMTEEEEKEEYF